MAEFVGRAAGDDTGLDEVGEVGVPSDFAEADDDADLGEGGDFGCEVWGTVPQFVWGGLVAGRCAAEC